MRTPTTEARRHRGATNRAIGRSGDRVIGKTSTSCHPERVRANASASRRIYAFLQRALELLEAVLREIFDESAYERFLARTKSTRSVASYGAFLREREVASVRKARCC